MTQAITFSVGENDIVFSGKFMAMNGVLKDGSLIMVSDTEDGDGLTISYERASNEVIFSQTGSLLLSDWLSGDKRKELYRCSIDHAETILGAFLAYVTKLNHSNGSDLAAWLVGCLRYLNKETLDLNLARVQANRIMQRIMAK